MDSKLIENYYEIASVSAFMQEHDTISVPDSRDLPFFCFNLAKDFEEEYREETWEEQDYLETIQAYAQEKLVSEYPPEESQDESAEKEFRVQTPVGELVAKGFDDDEYPGISIKVGKDAVAIVEYSGPDESGKLLQIHVYADPNSDEPTASIDLTRCVLDNADNMSGDISQKWINGKREATI